MARFIFWLIIIYIVYKFLTACLFPFLLKGYINKQRRKYKSDPDPEKRVKMDGEGSEIIIPRQKQKKAKPADHLGEYTEFEEGEGS